MLTKFISAQFMEAQRLASRVRELITDDSVEEFLDKSDKLSVVIAVANSEAKEERLVRERILEIERLSASDEIIHIVNAIQLIKEQMKYLSNKGGFSTHVTRSPIGSKPTTVLDWITVLVELKKRLER